MVFAFGKTLQPIEASFLFLMRMSAALYLLQSFVGFQFTPKSLQAVYPLCDIGVGGGTIERDRHHHSDVSDYSMVAGKNIGGP
jgi:hypothetical protein